MKTGAIPFAKMSGLGNDFIVVDDREGVLAGRDLGELAKKLCARGQSVGADELMVIAAPTAGGDLSMRTINPDGAEVKMCGNASRCVARYAFEKGIAGASMTIDTLGGPVKAIIEGGKVRVGLAVTAGPRLGIALEAAGRELVADWLEISGAPHAVVRLPGTAAAAPQLIRELGAAVRHHPAFPGGANANFIEVSGPHDIAQRTYERGVEGETLACGTGATASAISAALRGEAESPVRVAMPGGVLEISFSRSGDGIAEPFLGGGARFVEEGWIHPEAWDW